jgi:hypothetical protein
LPVKAGLAGKVLPCRAVMDAVFLSASRWSAVMEIMSFQDVCPCLFPKKTDMRQFEMHPTEKYYF